MSWTREDFLEVTEMLIEADNPLYLHPEFRKGLERNQNLFVNQVIREGQGNVAYRSVDFDIGAMSDKEFWNQIDGTKFNDFIEENAAAAILKMAERFNLVN